MQKRQDAVVNAATGHPVSGATVAVTTLLGVAATIYTADGAGLVSGNSVTTDANGRYFYYAADGRYTETITGSGITATIISDILLEDPVDGLAALSASGGSALVGFLPSGTGATAQTVQDVLRSRAFSIEDFGASSTGTAAANQTAIAACITAAKLAGRAVFVPGKSYDHNNIFTLDGVVMFGEGDASILNGTVDTATAIKLTGTRPAVFRIRRTGPTSATLSSNILASAFLVYQATDAIIEDVSASTFRYPCIPVQGSTNVRIVNPRLSDAWGGVFITNPLAAGDSKRIKVINPIISGMKDDALASVGGDASVSTQNEDIEFINPTVYDCAVARGIVFVGTKRGKLTGGSTRNVSNASGLLIGYDSTYSTQQCNDITISHHDVVDCGTSSLSAILLVGHGTETSDNIKFDHVSSINSARAGFSVTGAGTPGITNLSFNKCTIRNPATIEGLEIDFTKDITVDGVNFDTIVKGSMGFGTSCSGVLKLIGNTSRNDNTANTATNDWCTIAASSLTDIIAVGNARNGTNALERGIENGTTTAVLRGGNNAFNNTGTDYTTTLGGLDESVFAGTFTPTLAFGGSSTGITYTQQIGRYTRRGNRIYFQLNMVLSNKGAQVGNAVISGLPIASINAATFAMSQLAISASNLTFTGQASARVDNNSATVSFWSFASAGALTQLTDTAFANSTNIFLAGHYEIATF